MTEPTAHSRKGSDRVDVSSLLVSRDALSAGLVAVAASFEWLQTAGADVARDARSIAVASVHVVRCVLTDSALQSHSIEHDLYFVCT